MSPPSVRAGVWDSPVGGTRLYLEFHQNIPLTDGTFNVLIETGDFQEGSFDPALCAAQNRYLELIIDAEVLDPRQPFARWRTHSRAVRRLRRRMRRPPAMRTRWTGAMLQIWTNRTAESEHEDPLDRPPLL